MVYKKSLCKPLLLILFTFSVQNISGEQQNRIISGTILNKSGTGVSGVELYIYPSDYLNTNLKNGSFTEAYKSAKSTDGGFYKISTIPDKDQIVIGNHKNFWFIRKISLTDTLPLTDTLREGGSLVFFTNYSASNLRNTTAYIYGTPFRVKSNKDGSICFDNIPKGTLKSLIISELPGYHDIVCSLHIKSAQRDTFKDTIPFVYSGPQKIKNLQARLDSSGKSVHLQWECNLHINNGFRIFRAPVNGTFDSKPYSIIRNTYFTDTELQKFVQSNGYSYYIAYPGYINSDTVTVNPPKKSPVQQPVVSVNKTPVIRLKVHAFANHKTVHPFQKIHLYGKAEPQTEEITSWQWSIRDSPFKEVTLADTTITAPATAGKFHGVLKVISRNGQIALDTVTITVETGSLRVEASGKTSAGMFDKITLSSNVFSTKKVVSLGWDIGNTGSFTFTSDGRISFGPVKSPGKIMCIVRAIDETGEQDFDTLSVIVGLKWDSRQLPASYPNHKGQTLLTFNNRLWLIGGSVNDVWNSMDAQSWNLVTETAPFGKRYGHGSLVFQNRIWVIGGKIGHDSLPGDIYSSIDGKIWNREISASFLKRYYHSLVVSNDELFLISGINDSPEKPCLNDIWSTKDGLHWNLIAESAEFGPRYGHGSTLFRNSIIVAGGFYDGIDGSKIYTDMWSSKNGITWVKESDNIGFQNNQFLTLLNYDNKLWAFGGFYEGNNNTPGFSEITLSEDGISWTKISGQSPKTESYFLSGVIFNNKITLSPSGNRSILIMK